MVNWLLCNVLDSFPRITKCIYLSYNLSEIRNSRDNIVNTQNALNSRAIVWGITNVGLNWRRYSMESEAHRRQQQQHLQPSHMDTSDEDTSDDDLAPFIGDLESPNSQVGSSPFALVKSSFQRSGRYAKYSISGKTITNGLGSASSTTRRSRLLYSPWTVFTITILFFLLLYIPLFTFRDTTGMCKWFF